MNLKIKSEPLYLASIVHSIKALNNKYGSTLDHIIENIKSNELIKPKISIFQLKFFVREALSFGLSKGLFTFNTGRYFLNESKKNKTFLRKLQRRRNKKLGKTNNECDKTKANQDKKPTKTEINDMPATMEINDFLKIKQNLQNNCGDNLYVPIESNIKTNSPQGKPPSKNNDRKLRKTKVHQKPPISKKKIQITKCRS